MAGHSHSSNIKHKKGRSDKLKSELFLKLRKKIELAYSTNRNKEKAFSIARENNFPKEKVNLIIEKIENSRSRTNNFTENLYKGRYELLIYLRGDLSVYQEQLLEENIKTFSLEKLPSKRLQDHFRCMYLLRVDGCENIEEVIISSLSASIVDKITKIKRKEANGDRSEILFSEKWALTEAIGFLANYSNIYKLESREVFSPFSPVSVDTGDSLAYFSLLGDSFSKLGNSLQFFTNVSDEKWDHSSVG